MPSFFSLPLVLHAASALRLGPARAAPIPIDMSRKNFLRECDMGFVFGFEYLQD
jgi:hypothetical protein